MVFCEGLCPQPVRCTGIAQSLPPTPHRGQRFARPRTPSAELAHPAGSNPMPAYRSHSSSILPHVRAPPTPSPPRGEKSGVLRTPPPLGGNASARPRTPRSLQGHHFRSPPNPETPARAVLALAPEPQGACKGSACTRPRDSRKGIPPRRPQESMSPHPIGAQSRCR